jgi:hypothetical protein
MMALGAPCENRRVKFWRPARERGFVILLAVASCASGQTFTDRRITLYGYSEDATRIRFDVQNNYVAPITFYQIRLQAKCQDGTFVNAEGFSTDTLPSRASQRGFQDLTPFRTEAMEPGETRHFEFPRPGEVHGVKVARGAAAETYICDPAILKDFTVIFGDGTALGPHDLVDQQFAIWRAQREALKHWLDALHGLGSARDASAAVRSLRDKLNEAYDDCEDRPLTQQQIVPCQVNREIFHQVNKVWQLRSLSPETISGAVVRLTEYWERVAVLLDEQLSHRN